MNFCHQCGTQSIPGATYCINCGSKLFITDSSNSKTPSSMSVSPGISNHNEAAKNDVAATINGISNSNNSVDFIKAVSVVGLALICNGLIISISESINSTNKTGPFEIAMGIFLLIPKTRKSWVKWAMIRAIIGAIIWPALFLTGFGHISLLHLLGYLLVCAGIFILLFKMKDESSKMQNSRFYLAIAMLIVGWCFEISFNSTNILQGTNVINNEKNKSDANEVITINKMNNWCGIQFVAPGSIIENSTDSLKSLEPNIANKFNKIKNAQIIFKNLEIYFYYMEFKKGVIGSLDGATIGAINNIKTSFKDQYINPSIEPVNLFNEVKANRIQALVKLNAQGSPIESKVDILVFVINNNIYSIMSFYPTSDLEDKACIDVLFNSIRAATAPTLYTYVNKNGRLIISDLPPEYVKDQGLALSHTSRAKIEPSISSGN